MTITDPLRPLIPEEATRSAMSLSRPNIAFPMLLSLVILFLLRSPIAYRDIVFFIFSLGCFYIAARSFSLMWLVFVISLPFIHLGLSMFGERKLDWSRFFIMGMLIAFLIQMKKHHGGLRIIKHSFMKWYILFIIANMVSAIFSEEIESFLRCLTYLEPIIVLIISYSLIYENPKRIRIFYKALALSGMIVGALGLLELFLQAPLMNILGMNLSSAEILADYMLADRYGLGGRIGSTFVQPVYAAMAFAIYSILIVFYIVKYRPSFRWLTFLMVPLGLILMLATGSRGPMLALFPVIIVLIASRKKKVLSFLIGTLLIVGWLIIPTKAKSPIEEFYKESLFYGSAKSSSLAGRINLTKELLGIFLMNPIVGNGPGIIQKMAAKGDPGYERLSGLENQYASILAEGGILTGIVFIGYVGGLLMLSISIYLRTRNKELKKDSLLVLTLFIYLLINAFASSNLLGGPIIDVAMIVLGGTIAQYDRDKV